MDCFRPDTLYVIQPEALRDNSVNCLYIEQTSDSFVDKATRACWCLLLMSEVILSTAAVLVHQTVLIGSVAECVINIVIFLHALSQDKVHHFKFLHVKKNMWYVVKTHLF